MEAQYTLSKPPNEINWWDLEILAAVDPEATAQRWSEVIDYHRGNLESGHRAAMALEVADSGCQERAGDA